MMPKIEQILPVCIGFTFGLIFSVAGGVLPHHLLKDSGKVALIGEASEVRNRRQRMLGIF